MCPNHGAVDMKVQKSAAQCEKPFVRQPWTFIVTDEDVAWMANSAAARASEIGPQFDTEVFTTKRPKITVRRSNVLARTVKTKRPRRFPVLALAHSRIPPDCFRR